MQYNTGNYDKYMTKNPLKRIMVERLNSKILALADAAAKPCRLESGSVRILDAGCGEGFISNLLHAAVEGADIVGLELTEEALQVARSMNPELRFIKGDVTKLPFPDDSFDIVLCTEVLEHLPSPEQALRELLRVRSRKGLLILSVPNEPWFRLGNLLVLKNVTRLGNPIDHINHWSFSGFARFLKANAGDGWIMDRSFPWTIARYAADDQEKHK